MKLKKVFNPKTPSFTGSYENTLFIDTDYGSYSFHFDKSHIFKDTEYKISRTNDRDFLTLLGVIQAEELEWVEND